MSGKKPTTILDSEPNAGQSNSEIETELEATSSEGKSFSTGETTIELLRHGELQGGDTFRGSTDDELNDNGWQQMVNTLGDKKEWDIIVTSPLSSCREFAEVIAQEEEIDLEVNNLFKEIDFGYWEDKTPEEIMKEDGELLNMWWQSPSQVTPPSGEDFHDFRARVLKAFKIMLKEYQGKRILVVTHSGVIRVIIMSILGMQDASLFRLNVDYASYSKIQISNDVISGVGTLIEHR